MPADPNARVEENAPGPFYVDSSCIDCDVCRDAAPENFTRSFRQAYSYVTKQPGRGADPAAGGEVLEVCRGAGLGNEGGAPPPLGEGVGGGA